MRAAAGRVGPARPARIQMHEVVDVVRSAGRAGILMDGVSNAFEGRGATVKHSISNALSRAVTDGTLAWVSDPGKNSLHRRRYFVPEFAPALNGPATAPPPKPQTAKGPLRAPDGPAVIPPNVKVTVLPSAPVYSRHQLPPGERVIGGFASLGPGRYLDSMA